MEKSNYRPMRILPSLSKIHERLSYNQMHTDFSIFFPQYQRSILNGYSVQQCL